QAQTWRVQLRQSDDIVTVLVDDRTGTANPTGPQLAGDRVAAWIRWIHDGSRGGIVWQAVLFLCGLFPPVLAITGEITWLPRRGRRAAIRRATGVPQLGAAE